MFMSTRNAYFRPRSVESGGGVVLASGDGGRERVSEIQRMRVLAAMTEVAAERGAASVSVAHIVARSGVSRRTFYELFEDREACFLAAFQDATVRITARVLPAYQGEIRWRERIRAGLTALLDFLDEEPQTGRLCIVETLAAGPRALERRGEMLETLRQAVDEGRGQPRGRELPAMTAEGVIGAVTAVLHARLAGAPSGGRSGNRGARSQSFASLLGELMAMIVLPYEGAAAASREAARSTPQRPLRPQTAGRDSLLDLDMRLTYRTVRVLVAIDQSPGASNRRLADSAGVADQGQISKLLARLRSLGLVENTGAGPVKGQPNAWRLTKKGQRVNQAIQIQTQT
jgi:AcrR family transcriptional regulator